MRSMSTRQAILPLICVSILGILSACSPASNRQAVESVISPTPSVVLLPTQTATVLPSPTALSCLSDVGVVKQDVVLTTNPPQKFIIYLPSCYENFTDARFPVLYLLHGQTYNEDQWVRLGAPTIADQLIQAGESQPFIMVFPDDPYWNSEAGVGFGERFINDLIPYVDQNYRTLADREHRSLGGLSRGGGWTVQLGFTHPQLFGALGLHSPAIFKENAPYVERIIQDIPQETRPQLWLDIGESDMEFSRALLLEDILTRNDYLHHFYRFTGEHTELYWSAHTEEYLRWYTQVWQKNSTFQ